MKRFGGLAAHLERHRGFDNRDLLHTLDGHLTLGGHGSVCITGCHNRGFTDSESHHVTGIGVDLHDGGVETLPRDIFVEIAHYLNGSFEVIALAHIERQRLWRDGYRLHALYGHGTCNFLRWVGFAGGGDGRLPHSDGFEQPRTLTDSGNVGVRGGPDYLFVKRSDDIDFCGKGYGVVTDLHGIGAGSDRHSHNPLHLDVAETLFGRIVDACGCNKGTPSNLCGNEPRGGVNLGDLGAVARPCHTLVSTPDEGDVGFEKFSRLRLKADRQGLNAHARHALDGQGTLGSLGFVGNTGSHNLYCARPNGGNDARQFVYSSHFGI